MVGENSLLHIGNQCNVQWECVCIITVLQGMYNCHISYSHKLSLHVAKS